MDKVAAGVMGEGEKRKSKVRFVSSVACNTLKPRGVRGDLNWHMQVITAFVGTSVWFANATCVVHASL